LELNAVSIHMIINCIIEAKNRNKLKNAAIVK